MHNLSYCAKIITDFVDASLLLSFKVFFLYVFFVDWKRTTPSSHDIRLSFRHSLLHISSAKTHHTHIFSFGGITTSGIQLLVESGTMYHSLSSKSRSLKRNGRETYNAMHLFLTIEWALLSLRWMIKL